MKDQAFLDAKDDLARRLISDSKSYDEKLDLNFIGTRLLNSNELEEVIDIIGRSIYHHHGIPEEVKDYVIAFERQTLNLESFFKSEGLKMVFRYLIEGNNLVYTASRHWPANNAFWCFFHCQLDPENLYNKMKLSNSIEIVHFWDQHGGFVGFEDNQTKEGVVSVLLSDDQKMKANKWRRE